MARNMVTKYGMSEQFGPMYHDRAELENLSPASREAVEVGYTSTSSDGSRIAGRVGVPGE